VLVINCTASMGEVLRLHGCSELHLSRRTHNEYPASALRVSRVSGVDRSLRAHVVRRTFGVLLTCTFMRRVPRTILNMQGRINRYAKYATAWGGGPVAAKIIFSFQCYFVECNLVCTSLSKNIYRLRLQI